MLSKPSYELAMYVIDKLMDENPEANSSSGEVLRTLSVAVKEYEDHHIGKKLQAILCPFHQEETPSCMIDRHKGTFHCFGCGKEGTAIEHTDLRLEIKS